MSLPQNENVLAFELESDLEVSASEFSELAASVCRGAKAVLSFLDPQTKVLKFSDSIQEADLTQMRSACEMSLKQRALYSTSNYMSSPLIGREGAILGAICILGVKELPLNEVQKSALEILSRQLVQHLELKKTHRLLTENFKKLLEDEKQKSFEVLSSGVAHEVNNPLTIVIGKIEGVKLGMKDVSFPKKEKVMLDLDSVLTNANRIRTVVSALKKDLDQRKLGMLESCSLNALLNEALLIHKAAFLEHKIEVRLDLRANSQIECSKMDLVQAFSQIIKNAIDAIKTIDERWIQLYVTKMDQKIKISFINSGVRISEETVKQMMDPFFTTKPVGEGSGLGLWSARQTLERLGGALKYDADAPHTRFLVILNTIHGL